MSDQENPTQIDGSKLTRDQIDAAKKFLTTIGWPESEAKRTVSREDIAKAIAWYGAIRFQAGAHGIGSLEHPSNTIAAEKRATSTAFEITFEEFKIEDVRTYKP